jgi:hypothetical protein
MKRARASSLATEAAHTPPSVVMICRLAACADHVDALHVHQLAQPLEATDLATGEQRQRERPAAPARRSCMRSAIPRGAACSATPLGPVDSRRHGSEHGVAQGGFALDGRPRRPGEPRRRCPSARALTLPGTIRPAAASAPIASAASTTTSNTRRRTRFAATAAHRLEDDFGAAALPPVPASAASNCAWPSTRCR